MAIDVLLHTILEMNVVKLAKLVQLSNALFLQLAWPYDRTQHTQQCTNRLEIGIPMAAISI